MTPLVSEYGPSDLQVMHDRAIEDASDRYGRVSDLGWRVAVQHTLFCGSDMGLRIYVHPSDMAPLLPPKEDLSQLEAAIIDATASFKSSYNGKDRYSRARPDSWSVPFHGYTAETFPSREEWSAATMGLIGKGFLDKRGALTIKGRNARVRNPRS